MQIGFAWPPIGRPGRVLISHNLALGGEATGRVAVMRAGRSVETGPCYGYSPHHAYMRSSLAAVPAFRTDARVRWQSRSRSEDERLSRRVPPKSPRRLNREVAGNMAQWSAQFLLSALSPAQFPKAGAPEIAFLGRSNVGKSSLLNALVGASAARVSSTPGRTRAINFFSILDPNQKQKKIFADLPGYGYAKISKSISAGWPAFIEPYLADRSTLALCVCLIDSNVPAQTSDGQLFEWLRSVGREFVVVATKIDRLSGNERTRNLKALKRAFEVEEIIPVSAKTAYGLKELSRRIEEAGTGTMDQGNHEGE